MKAKRRVPPAGEGRPSMPSRVPMDRKRYAHRPPIVASTSTVAAEPSPQGPAPAPDLSVDVGRGLVLESPILVASGTFGYGVEYGDVVDIQRLGAICCKGTTLRPRIGKNTPRGTETPGGMLNSIGLQNPGVDAVVAK